MPITGYRFYDLEAIKEWKDKKIGNIKYDEESGIYWQIRILQRQAGLLDLKLKKKTGEFL